jgi:2-methylisocitrate lyase-like PEP mutase family enzyme
MHDGPSGPEMSVPLPLRAPDRAAKVAALRHRLDADEPLLLPGVTNALFARLVEDAGFEACYVTGAGIANIEWALPDIGLIGGHEMAIQVSRIADATTLPLIADADNGYGGPISVIRTVHDLERAGVAAMQFEDQSMPKRCGHFERKALVTEDEMVAKLRAARLARSDDTVIIARTDAIAVEGFDLAMSRARAYLDAGADVLFIEAPQDDDQLRRVGREFRHVPLVINVVEGGRTPELPVAAYAEMGYDIILYANLVMGAALRAADDVLQELRTTGDHRSIQTERISWARRQSLVRLDAFDDLEDALRGIGPAVVATPAARDISHEGH